MGAELEGALGDPCSDGNYGRDGQTGAIRIM